MELTFDLETLPANDPQIIADIHATIKPPGNLKKAETIEAWWKDEGDKAKADAVSKTALDGTFGRICCIGFAFNDEPAQSLIGGDEGYLISTFFAKVKDAARVKTHQTSVMEQVTVIGHNITGFDLRFLWQRAVIHNIPRLNVFPWKAKPWDDRIIDTMLMWNSDNQKRISLDKLCKALGVNTSKGDLDGSKIAQVWADGRQEDIARYCEADVIATRECWLRMR
jgi:hypothetical protein